MVTTVAPTTPERRKHRADQHDRDTHPPRILPEHLAHREQQLFGDLATFKHHAQKIKRGTGRGLPFRHKRYSGGKRTRNSTVSKRLNHAYTGRISNDVPARVKATKAPEQKADDAKEHQRGDSISPKSRSVASGGSL